MPAISNLVIADATPTNKTLYPLSASIASSRFMERAANLAAGNKSTELKLSLATTQRPTDRVTLLYGHPYELQVDGVWAVQNVGRMSCEFVIPADWTSTERGHFYALCKNLVAHATVQAYVKDRDPAY